MIHSDLVKCFENCIVTRDLPIIPSVFESRMVRSGVIMAHGELAIGWGKYLKVYGENCTTSSFIISKLYRIQYC